MFIDTDPSASLRLAAALLAVVLAGGCRSPERAHEHERAAADLLKTGQVEEAMEELHAALDAEPASVKPAISLASLYEAKGNAAAGIEILRDVLREVPGAHLARLSLARIYVRVGELDRALEQYAAVGRGAGHAAAYLGMADIYLFRGEESAAERAVLAAIQSEPTNASGRYKLARLYDDRKLPAARDAWERYLSAAIGNPDERAGIEEAHARLLVLAPSLSREEKAAVLTTLRKHLEAAPAVFRGPLAVAEAAPVAADAGPPPLRRFYSGRFFVKLHLPDADPVRGVGSGATLYEGISAAAADVRKSKVFDLYYASSPGKIRSEVHLEVGAPADLVVDERGADVVPREGPPFADDEALELKLPDRAIVVLPTDRAARGLSTLKRALEFAAREAGLGETEWRKAALRRVRVRGFVEAADGGGGPVSLEGGLPEAPSLTHGEALETARAAASWMAGLVGTGGALPSAYDPISDRYVTATAQAQARAVAALAIAGEKLADARFSDAARLADRWLRTEAVAPATITASAAVVGPAADAQVRDALRRAYDSRGAYLFRDRGRLIGAFRRAPFDPSVSLDETAHLVILLLSSAPTLPETPRPDAPPRR